MKLNIAGVGIPRVCRLWKLVHWPAKIVNLKLLEEIFLSLEVLDLLIRSQMKD